MEPTSQLPPRPINRLQLVSLLMAIPLISLTLVVSMVATHRPPSEPHLDVKVTQDVTVHAPRKSPDNPRILPCLIIENPTLEHWRNVAVSVNKEFFFYHPGTLDSGENFTVPLEFFVTKGGNVAFQPGSESVYQVTVFAQIPSGARAVSEIYFDQRGNATEKKP